MGGDRYIEIPVRPRVPLLWLDAGYSAVWMRGRDGGAWRLAWHVGAYPWPWRYPSPWWRHGRLLVEHWWTLIRPRYSDYRVDQPQNPVAITTLSWLGIELNWFGAGCW